MVDFQVVVLAGRFSKTLVPLVSKEVPKALLPVANRPVILYVLELLEQNDLKNAIVVTVVPEDVGTAGALRAIDHRLTANDILNALLEFKKVSNVKEQVVAGTMYYIMLEAADGGRNKVYEAKVWMKPWLNFKQVAEFKHVGDA